MNLRDTSAIFDSVVLRSTGVHAHGRRSRSGENRHHGVNIEERADFLWAAQSDASEGLSGSTRDLTAARHYRVFDVIALTEAVPARR
ncbi:hypothetical protein [Frankia sp. Cr2]|uniref:hypothetical protein n=1 Tax=Frankia sp. Cr2 TaxID=3073932 RepID=UPI002AD217C9|nr:hypothetical protein [Frankia sp. Cr2]